MGKAPHRRLIELGGWAPKRSSQHDEETTEADELSLYHSDSADKPRESALIPFNLENHIDESGNNSNTTDNDSRDQNISTHDLNRDSNCRNKIGWGRDYIECFADNPATRHPEARRGKDNDPETEDTWLHLRHITISRDQTKAGASEKEKLAALDKDIDDPGTSPVSSANISTDEPALNQPLQGHNPLNRRDPTPPLQDNNQDNGVFNLSDLVSMDFHMPKDGHNLSDLVSMGFHMPKDGHQRERHRTPSISTNNSHEPGGFEESSNALRIIQLEKKIQELRKEQRSLKSTTWLVLHKIMGDELCYLLEPSWTLGLGCRLQLIGNSPLANQDKYLSERPDLAFVVYKHYERYDDRPEAGKQTTAEGPMLDAPVPARETIQLLSKQMILAVDEFIDTQPTFENCFPNWDSKEPIHSPFLFWYNYRSTCCLKAIPEPHRSQMRLLTEWIDQNYNGIYAEAQRKFERGYVSWSTMPFFVRPGEVLITKNDEGIQGYIAESWALEKASPQQFRSSLREEPYTSGIWSVNAWSYGYDGQFYRQDTSLDITLEFDDIHRDIDMAELAVLPMRFVDEKLRAKLDYRGRTMWACRKRKLVAYQDSPGNGLSGEGERYMIDFGTYKQLYSDTPKFKASYTSLTNTNRTEMADSVMKCQTPPQGPELFVFPSKLVGYNLRQKQWRDLEVDLIQDVSWNKEAFAHLVIKEETKDLIQALVTSKLETEESTDLIHGKGNGLIILLHGGPGTGKTFTAESVAEIAEKPLYRVTCGDIGTKPEAVEKYLESVLYLGKIWDCVVLLDEADVFLEQRTLMDLERNALVSVFLRVLEYYEGILVLTSNRVGTFDEAFKSRIQLSLHYEALSKSQRRMIWRNFLCRLKTLERDSTKMKPIEQRKRKFEEPRGISFDNIERHLGDLAEHEMNGRQIRNAITTARQLAKFKGDEMEYRHLKHVIETSREFDKYLESVRDNYTDDQIARGEGFR